MIASSPPQPTHPQKQKTFNAHADQLSFSVENRTGTKYPTAEKKKINLIKNQRIHGTIVSITICGCAPGVCSQSDVFIHLRHSCRHFRLQEHRAEDAHAAKQHNDTQIGSCAPLFSLFLRLIFQNIHVSKPDSHVDNICTQISSRNVIRCAVKIPSGDRI